MLWNCWDVEGGCTPIYRHIQNIVLGKNLLYLSVLVTLTVQPCTKLTNTMRKRTQIIFATKQPFKTEFATRVQHDWITFLGKLIVYMSDLLNFVSLLQKGKLKHVYLSHFSRPQWLSQCKTVRKGLGLGVVATPVPTSESIHPLNRSDHRLWHSLPLSVVDW